MSYTSNEKSVVFLYSRSIYIKNEAIVSRYTLKSMFIVIISDCLMKSEPEVMPTAARKSPPPPPPPRVGFPIRVLL